MKKRLLLMSHFITIILIYFLAFGAVYFLFYREILSNTIINVLIADVVATLVIFLFSIIFNNSSVYDPYWSVAPPVIVLYLIHQFPDGNNLRQIIILVLVTFWSLRLTINWFRGWKGFGHQDWRYINIANKTGVLYWPVSFLGIHLMPTLFVFLGCLPLWVALSSSEVLNFYDGIAALFTFIAILIECIADEQLLKFRKKKIKSSFMKSGLWSISRHPNYLGEICFWLGLFLFVLSSSQLTGFTGYWTGIGSVFMLILFKFISIPMMEKRNKERKVGYQEYINDVPALFPAIISNKRRTHF